MIKYKHKKTNIIVSFISNDDDQFYENQEYEIQLIPELVEDSNDWEEVVEHKYIVVRYKDAVGNEYYRKENGKFTINYNYEYDEDKLVNPDLLIQTIRHVSDDVNFNVGDKVVWDWEECDLPYFTITGFFYKENELRFSTKEGSDYNLNILLLSHYKPEPLYRSYDGYDIYKGDEFHIVNKETFNIIEYCKYPISDTNLWLIFYHINNLHEYIWLNKPCLSINDVAKVYVTANRKNDRRDSGWDKQAEQLINIVKKKL